MERRVLKRPILRFDKLALFADIGYEPHAGQILVHRSKAKMRVLACGVRWGKTTVAAGEATAELLYPRPDSIGWIVAPTYDQADRIFGKTVATFERQFAHRVVEIDRRKKQLVITNLGGGRSVLCSKSADRPSSLLGEGLDWLVLDEATRVDRSIWEEHLSQRLIDRGGSSLLLSTPRGCDWFYEKYRRGQKGRDPDCESWRSPSSDNPHLTPAHIEAERTRVPADIFAQEYEAVFHGEDRQFCDSCGWDPTRMTNIPFVNDSEWRDEDIPTCAECGRMVDLEGRTIVTPSVPGRDRFLMRPNPRRHPGATPPTPPESPTDGW